MITHTMSDDTRDPDELDPVDLELGDLDLADLDLGGPEFYDAGRATHAGAPPRLDNPHGQLSSMDNAGWGEAPETTP